MHSRKKLPSSSQFTPSPQNGSMPYSSPRGSGSAENGRNTANATNCGGARRNNGIRAFKQAIEARFREFLAGDQEELHLEPMPSEQRKQAHIVARRLDLRSTSHGKEPNRFMTVKRVGYRQAAESDSSNAYFNSDPIKLSQTQEKLIRDFMDEHPIEELDMKFHVGADNAEDAARPTKGRRGAEAPRAPTNIVPQPPRLDGPMERFRRSLPTHAFRQQILDSIESNRVTVITGGTGCGKSTQVPQFLLEQACDDRRPLRIVCTQPRRLPALAVAKRVATERGERIGGTVGYHIRLEQRTSAETLLTYCTSGVLLRQLSVDPVASDVSHIILDEIHEREQCTDYLLIVLREALRKRPDLRLILMSATMEGQLELFRKYFGARSTGFVDIPSRLHHVEKFCLEEVLAMTCYMPTTMFGGVFDPAEATSSGQWGNGGFGFASPAPPPPPQFEPAADQIGSFGNAGFCSPATANPDQNNADAFGGNYRSPAIRGKVVANLERQLGHNRPTHFTETVGRKVKQLGWTRLEADTVMECYAANCGANQMWNQMDGVDQDLLGEVLKYLMDSPVDGALLVFLPGFDDIMQAKERLNVLSTDGSCRRRPIIYTLHSQMNTNDQQRVFDPVAKEQSQHYRKVILSTNIAEASLTIDDVVFVIDSGKSKEQSYDHETRVNQLRCGWIAKSNAEQRAGRAGRVRDGYCFRLYSSRDYERMLPTQVPEMRRVAIHDICLNAKMFAPGIQNSQTGRNLTVLEFLMRAPDPPPEDSVKMSLEFLEQLGALYRPPPRNNRAYAEGEEAFEPDMTDLGRLIAHLPLEPQLARMLLFGLVLRCFNPVVTLVAALSYQDRAFSLPMGDKERKAAVEHREVFARRDLSDHLMLIRAYNAFAQVKGDARRYCHENFLNPNVMFMIQGVRRQLIWELKRLSLLPSNLVDADDPAVNQFGHSWPMVKCAIVAGCYPGIGFVKYGQRWKKIQTNVEKQQAGLHPASALKRQVANGCAGTTIEYLAYHELSRIDEGLTLKTVTAVTAITVMLFAGPIRMAPYLMDNFELCEEDLPVDVLKLDEWREKKKRSKPSGHDGDSCEVDEADDDEMAWAERQEMERYEGRMKAEMNYSVELEPWLTFLGRYDHMQSLVRLRFKLMQYFLYRLKSPLDRVDEEEMKLLSCLNAVLCEENKKCGFPDCTDLNGQQQDETDNGGRDAPNHRPPSGRFNPMRDGRNSGPASEGGHSRYPQSQRDRYPACQSRWDNNYNRGGGGDYQGGGGTRSQNGGSWR